LVETTWDTDIDRFKPGEYSFRVTVDYNVDVKELREGNNVFPSADNENSSEVVFLEGGCDCGDPELEIESIIVSKYTALINEIVSVNVTIINTGDGQARYVDVYYIINNEFQYFLSVNAIEAGMAETRSFAFTGDAYTSYSIKFEIKDDGVLVAASNQIRIYVDRYPVQNHPILTIDEKETSEYGDGAYYITGTASDDVLVERVEYRRMGTSEWMEVEGTTNWFVYVKTSNLSGDDHTFQFRAYDGQYYSDIERITIHTGEDESIPGFEFIFIVMALLSVAGRWKRTSM